MNTFKEAIDAKFEHNAKIIYALIKKREEIITDYFKLFERNLLEVLPNILMQFKVDIDSDIGTWTDDKVYEFARSYPIIEMPLTKNNYVYTYVINKDISNDLNTFYRNIFTNTTMACKLLTMHVKKILGDDFSINYSKEDHIFHVNLVIKKIYHYY